MEPQREVLFDFKVVNTDAASSLTSIALYMSGLFWSPPLRKRKRSTSRRVLTGGRTSHLSSALPMAPSTTKASTFSGVFRHGWRRSGRCHTVELWASSTCDCRWPSCALHFTVYVGPGGSFLPLQRLRSSHRPTFLGCLLLFSFSSSHSRFSSLNAWLADLLIVSSYYSFSEFRTASFVRLYISDSLYIFFSSCSFDFKSIHFRFSYF